MNERVKNRLVTQNKLGETDVTMNELDVFCLKKARIFYSCTRILFVRIKFWFIRIRNSVLFKKDRISGS